MYYVIFSGNSQLVFETLDEAKSFCESFTSTHEFCCTLLSIEHVDNEAMTVCHGVWSYGVPVEINTKGEC